MLKLPLVNFINNVKFSTIVHGSSRKRSDTLLTAGSAEKNSITIKKSITGQLLTVYFSIKKFVSGCTIVNGAAVNGLL